MGYSFCAVSFEFLHIWKCLLLSHINNDLAVKELFSENVDPVSFSIAKKSCNSLLLVEELVVFLYLNV